MSGLWSSWGPRCLGILVLLLGVHHRQSDDGGHGRHAQENGQDAQGLGNVESFGHGENGEGARGGSGTGREQGSLRPGLYPRRGGAPEPAKTGQKLTRAQTGEGHWAEWKHALSRFPRADPETGCVECGSEAGGCLKGRSSVWYPVTGRLGAPPRAEGQAGSQRGEVARWLGCTCKLRQQAQKQEDGG